jgi:hypothetical protein
LLVINCIVVVIGFVIFLISFSLSLPILLKVVNPVRFLSKTAASILMLKVYFTATARDGKVEEQRSNRVFYLLSYVMCRQTSRHY